MGKVPSRRGGREARRSGRLGAPGIVRRTGGLVLIAALSLVSVGCLASQRRPADADIAARQPVCVTGAATARDEATTGDAGTERASPADINAPFRGELDADTWLNRFEGESREIYRERYRILDAIAVREGQEVADIGAGTGLFTLLFAERVGPAGRAYAVEIAPAFLDLIRNRAKASGLTNVHAVLCPEDGVNLPDASIDLAFICDTYHHFEHPKATMTSLRRALRPGGEVVVIDFRREPGVSRQWVLDHVRCGREEVIREIEACGFRLVETPMPEFLEENYILRFDRGEPR